MRADHANDVTRPFSEPVSAPIVERWWHGVHFAIGAGSLVEAQSDRMAGDRAHAG